MTVSLAVFLIAGSALADCQVSKQGRIISRAAQDEVTVLQLETSDLIEVRSDVLSLLIQYRRAATDSELYQAQGDRERLELALNGIVVDEQDLDLRGGYQGLDTTIEGYRVQCTR